MQANSVFDELKLVNKMTVSSKTHKENQTRTAGTAKKTSQELRIKYRENCKSCPEQVTWKVKFECQICLSSLDLSVLCYLLVLVQLM